MPLQGPYLDRVFALSRRSLRAAAQWPSIRVPLRYQRLTAARVPRPAGAPIKRVCKPARAYDRHERFSECRSVRPLRAHALVTRQFGLSATLGQCRRRSPCTGVGIPSRTLCQESAAVGPVKSWWFLQHSWRPLVVLDMSTWHLFPRSGQPHPSPFGRWGCTPTATRESVKGVVDPALDGTNVS